MSRNCQAMKIVRNTSSVFTMTLLAFAVVVSQASAESFITKTGGIEWVDEMDADPNAMPAVGASMDNVPGFHELFGQLRVSGGYTGLKDNMVDVNSDNNIGINGNRSVLGQNFSTEFVMARFTSSGESEKLVEIE